MNIFSQEKSKIETDIVGPHSPLYSRVAKRDQTDVSLFHAILLAYDIKQRRDIAETAKPFRLLLAHTYYRSFYETLSMRQILTRMQAEMQRKRNDDLPT